MGLMCILRNSEETIIFGNVISENLSKETLIFGVGIKNNKFSRVSMSNRNKSVFLNMIIDGVLDLKKENSEYFLR